MKTTFTLFLTPPNEFDPASALFEVCIPVEAVVAADGKVKVKQLPACTVAAIRVKGEIDVYTAPQLRESVLDLIARGQHPSVRRFAGYWLDIGRRDDYMQAIDEFDREKGHLLPQNPRVVVGAVA